MPLILPHGFLGQDLGEPMRAVVFNGSTYIGRSTGSWSTFLSSTFTASFWIRFRTSSTNTQEIYSHAVSNIEMLNFYRASGHGGGITFLGRNSNPSTTMDMYTSTSFNNDTDWHHILVARSGSTDHCYVDGVADTLNGLNTSGSIYWFNGQEFHMGTNANHSNILNAELGDFWLASSYLDITNSAIREQFIKNGRPMWLGDTGVISGATPRQYNTARYGNYLTNLGVGNNWSVESGSLSYVETPLRYANV